MGRRSAAAANASATNKKSRRGRTRLRALPRRLTQQRAPRISRVAPSLVIRQRPPKAISTSQPVNCTSKSRGCIGACATARWRESLKPQNTPRRARTCNLRFRRPMLYPIELGVRAATAGRPANRASESISPAAGVCKPTPVDVKNARSGPDRRPRTVPSPSGRLVLQERQREIRSILDRHPVTEGGQSGPAVRRASKRRRPCRSCPRGNGPCWG